MQQIPIDALHPFTNHPFKVLDDEAMTRTVESIAQYGVLAPLIARPRPEGGYEIISGHRRQYAAKLAGLDTLPVIVRKMSDDAAVILMVDSNLQREHILPSERAFAYKMKLEALKNQGARSDLTSDQVGQKLWSVEQVANDAGESKTQVQRFIRLTNLIPELLDMVDEKKIAFNPAVELSYLDESQQRDFLEAMEDTQNAPSLSQAQRLKKLAQEGHFTYDVAFACHGTKRKRTSWTRWSSKTTPCGSTFPRSYTPKQMEDTIIKLLDTVAAQTAAAERTLTYTVTKDPMGSFFFANNRRKSTMNTTIDLKTAKTIEAMNQKINHMDNAVTDFFNKMSDVLELQLGDDEVYAAVIAPEIELTITHWRTFAVPFCLALMKDDSCYISAKGAPLSLCYDPSSGHHAGRQAVPVRPGHSSTAPSGTVLCFPSQWDLYRIQSYLGEHSIPLMADDREDDLHLH